MPFQNGRIRLLAVTLLFTPALFADLSTASPALPPQDSIYDLANTCISVVCLTNITLSQFVPVSSAISGGSELTVSDVTLTANVFQNLSGMPGVHIGPLTLTGEIDITYFSRTDLSEFGTFNSQITLLDLSGQFLGLDKQEHLVEAMLNPHIASTGETTVTPEPPPPAAPKNFIIASYFDVYAELKIDNGPFVPGPPRMANLAPEPSYYLLTGCMLAALIIRRIMRKRAAS